MATIDTSGLKDPYVRLQLKDGREVVAKLDDEGVALDVWDGDEVVESTWKLYDEMEEEDGEDTQG